MARTLEEARARLRARLAEAGVAAYAEDYLSVARPAVILRPAPAPFESDPSLPCRPADEDDIPVGSTKAGGWPDLPRVRSWPGGSFVVQIALADVPEDVLALPREGLLLLFADPEDTSEVVLDWVTPELGRLYRTLPPDEACLFLPRKLTRAFAMTLDLEREEAPVHDATCEAVFDALDVSQDGGFIQLGGDPHVLNSMMDELEELGGDRPDLADEDCVWRLVLRVGSLDECEMDWGSGLYVWMRLGDLTERRFENAVAIVQPF